MARKNRNKDAHGSNHERWLITYADLITLLLVFFIIMYAMSKIDTSKYTILSQALSFQFQKADTIFQNGHGVTGTLTPTNGKSKDSQDNQRDNGKKIEENEKEQKEQKEKEQKEKELQDLLKKINAYIEDQKLQTQVSAADTPKGIAITLSDLFLFDLGKADLKPAGFPILEKLSSLLPTLNTTISIEGHTDNIPLTSGSLYKDNWGLSYARSLSVLRFFKYNAGLDDTHFMATAYADTKPKVENNSDANRAKNRRVEIVVLREK